MFPGVAQAVRLTGFSQTSLMIVLFARRDAAAADVVMTGVGAK